MPDACGHPLRVTLADDAAAAVRVVVLHDAVDHVRDGLEAPVRMPRCTDGFVRCVLDGAELVEQEERVRHVRVDAAGERPPHGEAGAFDGVVGGDDASDGTADRRRRRVGQSGEQERVGDSYSRHAARNIVDVSTIPA